MQEVIFNPINDKFPSGPLKVNENMSFVIRVRCDFLVEKVMLILRYEKDNSCHFLECKLKEHETNYFVYEVNDKLSESGFY